MKGPYELELALRYLRFHRGRTFLSVITLISVAGVIVGTAALVIALSLMSGFQQDVRERILRGSAHLQVLSGTEAAFDGADALLREIERQPGVAAVGPVLSTPAMITSDVTGLPAYAEIYGIDPHRQGAVVDFDGTGGDPFVPLARDGETAAIVLARDLARKLGVGVGDTVRVLVPRLRLTPFGALPRSRIFRVAGVAESGGWASEAARSWIAIEAARSLLDAPGRASWIEIRLTDVRDLERRKHEIASALPRGWVVMDLLEQNAELLKALNTEKLMLFLAIGLIVVVASLNIVSTLILMVTDKIREIGTLTALGSRPGEIARIFVLQGTIIGSVGTSLGLAIGVVASRVLDAYQVIKLNPDVYFIDHVPFDTRPGDVVIVGLVALAISFASTLYPAWKAARLEPVEALRYE